MDGLRRRVELKPSSFALCLLLAACGQSPAASGPLPSPSVACGAVPADKCAEAVESVSRSLPTSPIKSIEVICVSGTCTSESGAMETVVTLLDGSELRSSTISWTGPPAASTSTAKPAPVGDVPPPDNPPGVPIPPICQGIPVSMCDVMAETAFGELSTEGVTGILVRCGADPCTVEKGGGETIVTYEDGSSKSTTWNYSNGGG